MGLKGNLFISELGRLICWLFPVLLLRVSAGQFIHGSIKRHTRHTLMSGLVILIIQHLIYEYTCHSDHCMCTPASRGLQCHPQNHPRPLLLGQHGSNQRVLSVSLISYQPGAITSDTVNCSERTVVMQIKPPPLALNYTVVTSQQVWACRQ